MNEFQESEPFVLRAEDVKAFEEHMRRMGWPLPTQRQKSGLFTGSLKLFSLATIIGLFPASLWLSHPWLLLAYVPWVIFLAVYTLLYWKAWWRWWWVRRHFPRLALSGEAPAWQVSIVPEGIWKDSERGPIFLRWSAIWDIYATPEYVFIWIGRREVILVPRRAFASDAAFVGFVRDASRYCKEDDAWKLLSDSRGQTRRTGLSSSVQTQPMQNVGQTSAIINREQIQDYP
jgi:hypothetical protein